MKIVLVTLGILGAVLMMIMLDALIRYENKTNINLFPYRDHVHFMIGDRVKASCLKPEFDDGLPRLEVHK